jgi:hypothetical protein
MVLLASCTIVRKAPVNSAFIFENNIKITGKLSKKEIKELTVRLNEQIEDSVQIRKASKIPWPSFPWIIPVPVMSNPYPFKTGPVKQSVLNMQYLMASIGYRRSFVSYDTTIKKYKDQIRTTTNYSVHTGPITRIDSITYEFNNKILDSLVKISNEESLIQKQKIFNYSSIDREISRLTELFQNNGFARFTKEDIIAEIDTGSKELLSPMTDPFNYAILLSSIKNKALIPEADIYFKLKNSSLQNHFSQYTIGNVFIEPDTDPEDSVLFDINTFKDSLPDIYVLQKRNLFNNNFIKSQIQIIPSNTYTRDAYNKTINQLNKLGVWQNINISSDINDSLNKIDYTLKLQPAKKQYFSIDLEGSSIVNTSQLVQVGSGRVGLANNFTLRNRNIGRKAIQLENSLRTGIEFNNFKKILSGEITLTNRMTFPKLVAPISDKLKGYFQQARTIASVDFSYIDRFRFFQLNSVNTFIGYEWRPGPSSSWQFKPVNIEFTQFRTSRCYCIHTTMD